MSQSKKVGSVKFWNQEKGYGFIRVDGGVEDVFCHISAFLEAGLGEPARGARFQFDIGPSPDGRTRAVNLVPLPAAEDDKKWDDARTWNDADAA